ncbi:zinc finger protein 653 isoform X1 [Sinocyclocheilus anshuiensis]|uniref:zinc finger protein 653 isoform X1 n=1 Tax=Sinocyclocheilus anshuiensis TaxID=1608454 RepID=UPI0007BA24B9|nr:PREDICTED: zinc finger protein 653 isoform X1 [Sinocyclocheilus anshuiensis]
MAAVNTEPKATGEQIKAILRRCRGRPRLTDADRAQRRLESRKKYDVRRVYLGEAHRVWSELRRRTSLSDAGLAEYLILLNSAYGEKYQQKYAKRKTLPEQCSSHRKGKKVSATSLQTVASWYQGHCQSCQHEPELRAVEPTVGLSTSALWQCVAGHSFVQNLPWPAGGESESDVEDSVMEKDEEDRPPEKKATVNESINIKKRKLQNHGQLQDAISDLEDDDHHVEHQMTCTSLSDLPGSPAAHSSPPASERCLENQAEWEREVLMDREAQAALAESDGKASSQDASRESDPVREQTDASRTLEKADSGGGLTESYECVVVTAPLTDRQERQDGASCSREGGVEGVPSLAAAPAQSQLCESQDLQTVMGGCELLDQRSTLEGSQLIIIMGPSYEALTSEGIQLNVGGGDVEEVTCTLIGDVSYNQMCHSGASSRPSAVTPDLAEKRLLDPGEETHCSKAQQSLSRCKRSRRGPVIEADGMLKMFHCPYEGCSQVYVAISSFQNHVNLVHRKGRTKVCPHPGCGKKFYLSNHLHRHMIIHSGVRDFICETCGKSFKRKNHLEVHRRTHTGETPLQCEICGYQCRQRASLNWHMRKHMSEAHFNYTCENCGKRFEKLDSVKFHKLKSHPDKQST